MTQTFLSRRSAVFGPALWLLVTVALVACAAGPRPPGKEEVIPTGLLLAADVRPAPPRAPGPGECWGDETIPAIIETVTEQEQVSPGRFQTRTRQRIVSERQDVWFLVPCPELADPDFIRTLQRALKVRGFYRGEISAQMDAATGAAVRRYQAPQGLDSGTLSLLAARQLGLVAVERAEGR